jgi:hypothetical protein
VLGGAIGGYVGGGSNAGPEGSITVGYGLPRLPIVLELELGFRAQWMSTAAGTLGIQSSTLLVFPIDLAVRWEALASGKFRLSARGGGGLLLASHQLSSNFDAGLSQSALGWELFAAAQAGLRLGSVEPYLEVRGSVSEVSTAQLDAHPGGAMFSIGVRGELR